MAYSPTFVMLFGLEGYFISTEAEKNYFSIVTAKKKNQTQC